MKRFGLFLLVSLMVFFTSCNAQQPVKGDSKKAGDRDLIVVLETNQGNIELKMFPNIAPLAVENFTTHVKNGYYNGLIFHRVIKNFMIQGGDPTGTGRGGESIWHKEFVNEYGKNVVFDRPFLLAMANHGPNTNGSQFFITTKATPWLNGGYTIFGEVVSGQDVVTKIENTKTGRADRPVVEQKIIKAYIKS
jgi:peptidylprolyl isomerase